MRCKRRKRERGLVDKEYNEWEGGGVREEEKGDWWTRKESGREEVVRKIDLDVTVR